MLDYKFIKENLEAVKANIANRYMQADADKVVALYDKRNGFIMEIDEQRRLRNENAGKMKGPMEQEARQALIAEGKKIKDEISRLESEAEETLKLLDIEGSKIPNMAHPDAPVGKEDKDNTEVARFGEPAKFPFKAKDHVELMEALDLIDFETAARVSGSKFYYLKNEAVLLEMALTRYALDILKKHGFTLTITPDIAREEILEGTDSTPGAPSLTFTHWKARAPVLSVQRRFPLAATTPVRL